MTPAQQTQNSNVNSGTGKMAVHLLLTEGEMKLIVENPEQVVNEIQRRANQVSSILEGILLEPRGQSCWGINE